MLAYMSICFVTDLFYAVIMTCTIVTGQKQKSYPFRQKNIPILLVSVIIPVRNESGHIAKLMEDFVETELSEELIEIIFVDDHSDDDITSHIVRGFWNERIQLISLSELLKEEEVTTAYKKEGTETGIRYAKGEIIMTTDGDCRGLRVDKKNDKNKASFQC